MKYKKPYCTIHTIVSIAVSLWYLGCAPVTEIDDPQVVEIHLQYGFLNEVNTFDQTLTKDLVMDGSVTVGFRFTSADQARILMKAEELAFFEIPDTIPPLGGGIMVDPNPSPDWLRIRSGTLDHTVVWSYPIDSANPQAQAIGDLAGYIFAIVEQSAVYSLLPPARGGRL